MYLKRIELNGFKTFPDHTEVVLSSGVTAVVGPNGCGKSNLMDAVRWVLGEQRPRVLRGGKMEEVIFGGTPQRPGLAAAEVTLVIDNQSGRLPTEYAEVSVCRRIDRSGQSEYRLNGSPCRLKDFADLFLDTGMGSHGYAVIQAGMIDAILSENADECRFLFEEAAGVSKYKMRQRAALRKMEATEQDLLRLTDLKNEVATHVRSLARQKGMAERHRRLQERWREVEVTLASRDYRRLLADAQALQASYLSARDASGAVKTQCEALELEWQSQRLMVEEAERSAQAVADRLSAATAAWHAQKTEVVRAEDRRRHLEEERARDGERRETLSSRLVDAEERLREANVGRDQATALQQQIASRAREAEDAYRRAAEVAAQSAEHHRTAESAWTEAQNAHVRMVSRREALTHHREDIDRQREVQRERCSRQQELVRQSEAEVRRLTDALERGQQDVRGCSQTFGQNRASVAELESELNRLEPELQLLTGRIDEWRSGRELLISLVRSGEGLGQAATRILSDSDRWQGRVVGWIDRLRPQTAWRRAIEAVLADRVGALWCADVSTAAELTAFVREQPLGRAVILDPSLVADARPCERPGIDDPAFTGWLSEKLESDPSDHPWIEAIFGSVATVADAAAARRLYVTLGGRFTVASQDGLVVSVPGVVSAGTDDAEPILGRQDRVAEFDRRIAQGEEALRVGAIRLRELRGDMGRRREELDRVRSELAAFETEVSALQVRMEVENARLDEHRRQAFDIEVEMKQAEAVGLDDPAVDEGSSQEELRLALEESALRRRTSEEEVSSAEQRLGQAVAALNQVRVEVVEAQAQADAALAEIGRYSDAARELGVELAEITVRLAQISSESAALETQAAEASCKQRELAGQCESLEAERAQARAELGACREVLSEIEQRLRQVRHDRDAAEQQRTELEVKLSGLTHEAEQWRRRVLDVHQVDLTTVAAEDSPLSDAELQEKSGSLRQSMERLGPVNPLALEEYEREKQRWEFLEHQVGDLRQAKQSLAETIAELNRTAGERFLQTFESARAHFQEVFTELFRGGEADVHLLDPSQPLESPIEVFARPRGKKFIGIRQLSGGERALTALALLFGLYLVKPSPFCILDEVDAPLDDANCGRFLRLIDRFKSRTQFIVVTHNKLTMEAADVLYGVTMEQPGISKIVSVRLNRAGEETEEPGLAEPRFAIAPPEANGTPDSAPVEPVSSSG